MLEDLRARHREEKGLHEPLAVSQEAAFDLPPDYSETYEDHLTEQGKTAMPDVFSVPGNLE